MYLFLKLYHFFVLQQELHKFYRAEEIFHAKCFSRKDYSKGKNNVRLFR